MLTWLRLWLRLQDDLGTHQEQNRWVVEERSPIQGEHPESGFCIWIRKLGSYLT